MTTTSLVKHLCTSSHQRVRLKPSYVAIHAISIWEMCEFESNRGPNLDSAKKSSSPAQVLKWPVCHPSFWENRAILKLAFHLLHDVCKSAVKLLQLVKGLCQIVEHLPDQVLILQKASGTIRDQLSLLVWWEGGHNCHLTKEDMNCFIWQNHLCVQISQVLNTVLLFSRRIGSEMYDLPQRGWRVWGQSMVCIWKMHPSLPRSIWHHSQFPACNLEQVGGH